jgi:hypothetical protein
MDEITIKKNNQLFNAKVYVADIVQEAIFGVDLMEIYNEYRYLSSLNSRINHPIH